MSTLTEQHPDTAAAPAATADRPGVLRRLVVPLAFARSTTDRPGDVGLLIARVIIGAVFIGHGAQKLFAWWGGDGIAATGVGFEGAGLSPGEPLAVLAGAGEFFGGILLILGLLTRLGAFSVGTSMVIAIVAMHLPGPFLGGYEFPLTLLGGAVLLLLIGPGRLSVDALVRNRLDRSRDAVASATPQDRSVGGRASAPHTA
ncbi:MAG: DoxX family protein [Solirubrobacteraceae bacterium]|nr:DoxX family protein [Solirubrobacteraceae bacterium]